MKWFLPFYSTVRWWCEYFLLRVWWILKCRTYPVHSFQFYLQYYDTLVIVTEAISREFRVALPWELLYADDFKSPSWDFRQRQTMNHTVDKCALTKFEGKTLHMKRFSVKSQHINTTQRYSLPTLCHVCVKASTHQFGKLDGDLLDAVVEMQACARLLFLQRRRYVSRRTCLPLV